MSSGLPKLKGFLGVPKAQGWFLTSEGNWSLVRDALKEPLSLRGATSITSQLFMQPLFPTELRARWEQGHLSLLSSLPAQFVQWRQRQLTRGERLRRLEMEKGTCQSPLGLAFVRFFSRQLLLISPGRLIRREGKGCIILQCYKFHSLWGTGLTHHQMQDWTDFPSIWMALIGPSWICALLAVAFST